MVGLLIATHGGLAKTLVDCANLLMGKTEDIRCLGLFHGDNIDNFKANIKQNIVEIDKGDGVLVLTDLCGGSPCNLSVFIMKEYERSNPNIECISGVNVPILLEAIQMRNTMKIGELTEYLVEIGHSSILNVRAFYNL